MCSSPSKDDNSLLAVGVARSEKIIEEVHEEEWLTATKFNKKE